MQGKPIDSIIMTVRRNMNATKMRTILEHHFEMCSIDNISFKQLKQGFKEATVDVSHWHEHSADCMIGETIKELFKKRHTLLCYDRSKYWMIKVRETTWEHRQNLKLTHLNEELNSRVSTLKHDLYYANKRSCDIKDKCNKVVDATRDLTEAQKPFWDNWNKLIDELQDIDCECPFEKIRYALKKELCHAASKRSASISVYREANRETNAAIKIQSVARGFMARRQVFVKLYDEYIVKQESTLHDDCMFVLPPAATDDDATDDATDDDATDDDATIVDDEDEQSYEVILTPRRVTRSMT